MKQKLLDLFGWYGTVAIAGSYFLVSFKLLSPTGLSFQLLNVTGAVGLGLVSYSKRAYQPATLQLIWTLIGLGALAKAYLF
jgi:hypothetical protein